MYKRQGEEQRFVGFINFLAICKNICQRKLIVWYHIGTTPFRWIWLIVTGHLNFTINL